MAGKTKKGRNGTGSTLMIYFDASDPAERKALEAARLLAAKHGRRKQVIVTLLEAIYNHYEQTGDLLSSAEITTMLRSGSLPAPTFRAPVSPPLSSAEPLITQTKTKSSDRQKVAASFLSGMGGLLG